MEKFRWNKTFREIESDYFADMELIPNTAYVYFEFSGTSNVGGNELKVIRNVHVPLK